MTTHLASLTPDGIAAALERCGLTSGAVAAVLAQRPFADDSALCAAVDNAFLTLDEAELRRAVDARPEPAVETGNAGVRQATQLALRLYRDRFGYPYVSSIDAPTADELLMRVRIRLGNEPEPEGRAAREHLRRLARARLQTLLDADAHP